MIEFQKTLKMWLFFLILTTPNIYANASPTITQIQGERHFTLASDKIVYGTVNYYIEVTFTIQDGYSIIETDEILTYTPMKSTPLNYTTHGLTIGWTSQTEMYREFKEWDIAYNFRYYGPKIIENSGEKHLVYPYPAISNITLLNHYRIHDPILNRESNPYKTYVISAPALNTTLKPGIMYRKTTENRVNVTDPEVYYLNYFHGFKINFCDGTTYMITAPDDFVYGLGDFHKLWPRNNTIELKPCLIFDDLPYVVNTEESYSPEEIEEIRTEIESSMNERLSVVDSLESVIDDLEKTVEEQADTIAEYDELQVEYQQLVQENEALQTQINEIQSEEDVTQIPGFPIIAFLLGVCMFLVSKHPRQLMP